MTTATASHPGGRRLWAVAAVGGLILAGCGLNAPPPIEQFTGSATSASPSSDPAPGSPSPKPSTPASPKAAANPMGFARAEQMTVRVRNIGCSLGELSTGSGFAVAKRTLVTNRHVVAGTDELQLNTVDGRDISVSAASVAYVADLALVRTTSDLPLVAKLARADPAPGTRVAAVGYPDGGEQVITRGEVLGTFEDTDRDFTALEFDAVVRPGNSGGPLIDDSGRVVGVVYARNAYDSTSAAVPVSTLRRLMKTESFGPVPACDGGYPEPQAPAAPVVPDTPDVDYYSYLCPVSAQSLPDIQQGDSGTAVAALQQALTVLGWYSKRIDGDFGPITHDAVINYQNANGLVVDGLVGAQTWSSLQYDLC